MGVLNLPAIEASLRDVQQRFDAINSHLAGQREWMSDEVIKNLLAGYAYIDILVDWGIDVFAKGKHKYLLELNNIVLCGPDQELRAEFSHHIEATRSRFYEEPEGGIEEIVEWRSRRLSESVWKLAAGLYAQTLCRPQLFIEGNHRSSALIAGYLLLRDGKPPFVLTTENATTYFELSSAIRNIEKRGISALFRLPGLRRRFARFLEEQTNPNYLLTVGSTADHATIV